MRCFFYPQSSGWAIVALQLNVSDVKYDVGFRCTFFDTYIFVFVIDLTFFPYSFPQLPAMAPGVRNSKRVRAATQSDVLPFESEIERSKRLHVQDARATYDDNTATEDANGIAGHDNSTSEEGNVTADDNAIVDQDIGAATNENTLAEGKFFQSVMTFLLLI
jgi:hypothetical protein